MNAGGVRHKCPGRPSAFISRRCAGRSGSMTSAGPGVLSWVDACVHACVLCASARALYAYCSGYYGFTLTRAGAGGRDHGR